MERYDSKRTPGSAYYACFPVQAIMQVLPLTPKDMDKLETNIMKICAQGSVINPRQPIGGVFEPRETVSSIFYSPKNNSV